MMEIKTLNIDIVFFLFFVKNSKIHARYMVFWKRTIIMIKTYDHES